MKKIINVLLLSLVFCTACSDLELNPLSQAASGNWYSDKEQIEMTVNSLYHISFWRTDLDAWTDDWMERFDLSPITGATITSEFVYAENTWALAYKAIATTNILIDKLKKADGVITEQYLNQYKGEAHFVRAYTYSQLISHYGDAVYYDGIMDVDEMYKVGRTNKDEILVKIYEDFDSAASLLPIEYGSSNMQRATKGAALALKARIALYMGDFVTARDAAYACMNLNKYDLNSNFEQLFLTKNAKESIFLIPRSVGLGVYLSSTAAGIAERVNTQERYQYHCTVNWLPRNRRGIASNIPSWDLFCSFLCTDGLPIDESPLFDPQKPFKNRDPRCAATIVEFGSRFLNIVYQPHPDSIKTYSYITGTYIKNNDCLTNTQYAAYNGLLWKKGIDETWPDDLFADPDKVIIRYADVLLIYAEAKIELNEIDNSVLNAINQVRARAYKVSASQTTLYPAVTTTDQVKLRKILRAERRMEFANEGLRYMDIIRWRLAEKVLNKNNYGVLYPVADLKDKVVSKGLWFFPEVPQIDEDGVADFEPMFEKGLIRLITTRKFDATKQYLWPIPSKEVKINPNLLQNPNY